MLRGILAADAVTVVAVAGAVWWQPSFPQPLPAIAVIPVRAIGGAPAPDVVGNVVADDVISALSRSDDPT